MKKWLIVFSLLLFSVSLSAGNILDIKQFIPESEIQIYDPENLFEYIDGAADIFLSFGFQQLQVRDFSVDSLQFSVELYNMGTPLNAFGIYKSERPADASGIRIGAEAVISPPYQAIMLKGIHYVKTNIYEGELDSIRGAKILTAISKAIPGKNNFPAQIKLLPEKKKIAGSEGYAREAFLGMSLLKRCLFAKYQLKDGTSFRYFIMLPDSGETAETLWQKLATNWKQKRVGNTNILLKKIPYKGISAVMVKDNLLHGVADCKTAEQAQELLIQLLK
ncbi:hypothetical protein B6D60_09435 [candidate division KSB1 bacterium 4484_87]|nr:MAG: hypothetical protein B6D60_09435 [candidate division KSB1 bacterium 4484_87]